MPSEDPTPAADEAQQPTATAKHADAQTERSQAPPVIAQGGTTDAP